MRYVPGRERGIPVIVLVECIAPCAAGTSATCARPHTNVGLIQLLELMKRATAPTRASRERIRRRVLGALSAAPSEGADQSWLERAGEVLNLDSQRSVRRDESR